MTSNNQNVRAIGQAISVYQTDYKRFQEIGDGLCGEGYDPNANLYNALGFSQFRSVYMRYFNVLDSSFGTMHIPGDATVGQFCCAYLVNDDIDVTGFVDASEFWLFWFSILVLIWTYLAYRKHANGSCSVPLWYILGLLAAGLYGLFRSFGPATVGPLKFANVNNCFVPVG